MIFSGNIVIAFIDFVVFVAIEGNHRTFHQNNEKMFWDELFRRNFRTQMAGLDIVKFQNIEICLRVNLQFCFKEKLRMQVTFVIFR